MVVTGLLFVCVTGTVRYIGSDIPAPQSAFLRYAAGTVLVLPFMLPALRQRIEKRALAVFTVRGMVHAFGVMLWFYAMARIPIAEVTAIGYMQPIYVTIGAALFFGEKLAARRIGAVLVAFFGAMLILRPGFQDISSGQLAQVISAPLFAVSYLIAKQVTTRYSPILIVGLLSIIVTIGLAPFAISVWEPVTMVELALLCLVAVFATLGHLTMTQALKAAPLLVTQPVVFLQLVWATLLGALAFGEPVDIWVLSGGGVIIAAVSFISYREWQLSRRDRTPSIVEMR